MRQTAPPQVFISYSHDSEAHKDRVRRLAEQLRKDGVAAMIDQYEQAPPQGWPTWCQTQIEAARFVLMVCTATYSRRLRGDEPLSEGHGVLWEARLISQLFYDAGSATRRFVPLLLEGGSRGDIPTPYKAQSFFKVDTAEGL